MNFRNLTNKIKSLFGNKKMPDVQGLSESTGIYSGTNAGQRNFDSGNTQVTQVTKIVGQGFLEKTGLSKIGNFGLPLKSAKKIKSSTWLSLTVIAILALMTADLIAIKSRFYMIPAGGPNSRRTNIEQSIYKPRTIYDEILARNIFNSDGIIPELQIAGNGVMDVSGPARETQLDLQLVGTIVHANPGKSVATVGFKNNPEKVLPYIPNDDIEGLATVMKVERKRVYIRNLSSGAMEYIQIKDDAGITFQKKSASTKQDGPVAVEGDNTFGINRSDLETQMQNLPDLLTQARAVPNIVNGRVDGYKITEMTQNALFKKFGIADGDVIKEVDGEKLDSPAKAMELYNSLRSKSQIKMTVEKNGKSSTMTYNIR